MNQEEATLIDENVDVMAEQVGQRSGRRPG